MIQKHIFNICCMLLLVMGLKAQCNITATSSGGNATYTQVYVLVDASTNLIVAENNTGTFNAVNPGSYRVHALNFDPTNVPAPLPAALIGQDVSLVGSTTTGCFNADFLTDYVNRACASCQQSNTICETDPLIVSSSGANGTYTQLYVLVDAATDLIVGTSTSGDFTGIIAAGNSYQLYALNYNPADAPNPLPIAGQSVNAVGTVNAGCYNSDYLSDYVCYNVTSCTSPCFNNSSHCVGDDIIVSTSGENEAYTQVFVLADASGNFVAQNSSGVFPTNSLTSGATYRVHALNFNPSDPPAPLPAALNPGDPISNVGGGCFNADFLTDYLCFTLDCILLNQELKQFEGEALTQYNLLKWELANEEELSEMELERSATAIGDFQKIDQQLAVGELAYQTKDYQPLKEGYYRLKLKYTDGLSKYSDVIYIERQRPTSADFQLYPNPSSGQVHLNLGGFYKGKALEYTVYNTLGQPLLHGTIRTDEKIVSIDLSILNSGSYILSFGQSSWQIRKKLIKI
jgi:hypothetical protein